MSGKRMKRTCNKCWADGMIFGTPICWLNYDRSVSPDALEGLSDNLYQPNEVCEKPLTERAFKEVYIEKYPEADLTEILFKRKEQ